MEEKVGYNDSVQYVSDNTLSPLDVWLTSLGRLELTCFVRNYILPHMWAFVCMHWIHCILLVWPSVPLKYLRDISVFLFIFHCSMAWEKPQGDSDICFEKLLTQVTTFLLTVSKLDLKKEATSLPLQIKLHRLKIAFFTKKNVKTTIILANIISVYKNMFVQSECRK